MAPMTMITNVSGIFQLANNNTAGWFWFAILIMIFVVLLLSTLNFGIEISATMSSLICLALAMLLNYMGLVGLRGILLFFSLFIGMIIYIYFTSARENV